MINIICWGVPIIAFLHYNLEFPIIIGIGMLEWSGFPSFHFSNIPVPILSGFGTALLLLLIGHEFDSHQSSLCRVIILSKFFYTIFISIASYAVQHIIL